LLQNFLNIPPYVPSGTKFIQKALAAAKVDHSQKVIDLGSGDGRVVFMAARSGAEATGIDTNPILILWCKLRAAILNLFNRDLQTRFIWGSFFNHALSEYDVIFVYLFPETMEQLESKIFSEGKKGALIISNTFKFKNHSPAKTIDNRLHLYKI
jgi:ribosomal protein L11 methylase PrmA